MGSYLNPYKFSSNGISIGKGFKTLLDQLKIDENLSVHSIFQKVINLKTNKGLFSIVTSEVGRHSNYLEVKDLSSKDFLTMELEGLSCIYSNNSINFGNQLSILLKDVKTWEGVLDKDFKWRFSELNVDRVIALREAICIYGRKNNFYEKIFVNEDKYLMKAVKCIKFNLSEIILETKPLVGYGAGLTPAGDDFLTGYMAVLNSCGDKIPCRDSLKESLLANLYNTSYISANMLFNAVNSIYHEYIQNLIYAVVHENPEIIFEQTKKLITIGATSGSDLTTGIYLGFINALEYIGRQGENIVH